MTKLENKYSRRFVLGASMGAVALSGMTSSAHALSIETDIDASKLNERKATPLGLYLSPTAAHKAISENPEILFVDVRDPIEITFVGHPKGLTKIIPLRTATLEVNATNEQYKMVENPSVLSDFDALLAEKNKAKSDPIFVTCRSGSRSAVAAKMLIDAGYTNVWNLTEGFEGDRSADGSRSSNGWRNSGLPWAYKLEKGVAWSA